MSLPLNPEQQQAADARRGAWCVLSGPGSGKTRVIVSRYQALLEEGVPPHAILSLTFTREAAKEMDKRAGKAESVFRTFHSIALAFAQREADFFPFRLAHFPLPTYGQVAKLKNDILRRFRGINFRSLSAYISLQKRHGIRPETALDAADTLLEAAHAQAFAEYERRCREQGWLDYDSLLTEMAALLESDQRVWARWQIPWIQCDEAQDCDTVQWRLLRLLSQQHGNAFAVGDPSQNMYSWRGADPEGLIEFPARFPGGQYIYLGQNYRSTKAIVAFCKSIAPVKTELVARMHTENEQGVPPAVIQFSGNAEEAEAVVDRVTLPDEAAVLVRTNRQLRLFEDACMNRDMPYRLLGKSGFWVQPEVQHMLAFLRYVQFGSRDAVIRIVRSPYPPTRFLRKKELADWLKERLEDATLLDPLLKWPPEDARQRRLATDLHYFLIALRTACRGLTANEAYQEILRRAEVADYYTQEEEQGDVQDNYPLENVQELGRLICLRGLNTIVDVLSYASRAAAASRKRKGLTLSTIHQAKGKEWNTVFIAGLTEGVLPHKKGDPEEEKRIFYVACSRAAKRLYLTYHGQPSVFARDHSYAPNWRELATLSWLCAPTQAVCP